MTRPIKMFFFAFLGLLATMRQAQGQDISFCSLPLSKAVLQAHASFNAVYAFDVDKFGVPLHINAISKQFTKPEDVAACLGQWKLQDAIFKRLVVVFEWQHGIGWTKMAISGPGVNLTVRLRGIRCPYSKILAFQDNAKGGQ